MQHNSAVMILFCCYLQLSILAHGHRRRWVTLKDLQQEEGKLSWCVMAVVLHHFLQRDVPPPLILLLVIQIISLQVRMSLSGISGDVNGS